MSENAVTSVSGANHGGNLAAASGSTLTIEDSIVVDGKTSTGQSRNCFVYGPGVLTVTGRNIYNAVGGFSCNFPAGAVAATSAALSNLDDHGGVGSTAVPMVGSPAIDTASKCPESGLDQRLSKLPVGKACDIGAIDASADLEVRPSVPRGPVAPGAEVPHTAVVTNNGLDAVPAVRLSFTPTSGLADLWPSQGSCAATGVCDIGNLPVGFSKVVTLSAQAPASGELKVRAVATSGLPDPNPSNSDVAATTAVAGSGGEAVVIDKLRAVGKLRSGKRGKLDFNLNGVAKMTIVVSRVTKGRRDGGRCKPKAKKGKRCEIVKRVGSLSVNGKSGANTVALPARLGGRNLAPGRYRLAATATAPGAPASKTATATVKVVKAKKKRKK